MRDFPGSSRMLGGARIALVVACGLVGALSCANSSHPIPRTDGGAGSGAAGSQGSGGNGGTSGGTDASVDVPVSTDSGTPSDGAGGGTLTIGKPCTADNQCGSGFCTDGVCCETACHETCWTCSAQGTVGSCVPADVGTDPRDDCQDEGLASCGNDGTCDGSGACRRYATGTICRQPTCSGLDADAGVALPGRRLPADRGPPLRSLRMRQQGRQRLPAHVHHQRRLRRRQCLQQRQLRQAARRCLVHHQRRLQLEPLPAGHLLPVRLHRPLHVVRGSRRRGLLHRGARRHRSTGPVRRQLASPRAAPMGSATARVAARSTPRRRFARIRPAPSAARSAPRPLTATAPAPAAPPPRSPATSTRAAPTAPAWSAARPTRIARRATCATEASAARRSSARHAPSTPSARPGPASRACAATRFATAPAWRATRPARPGHCLPLPFGPGARRPVHARRSDHLRQRRQLRRNRQVPPAIDGNDLQGRDLLDGGADAGRALRRDGELRERHDPALRSFPVRHRRRLPRHLQSGQRQRRLHDRQRVHAQRLDAGHGQLRQEAAGRAVHAAQRVRVEPVRGRRLLRHAVLGHLQVVRAAGKQRQVQQRPRGAGPAGSMSDRRGLDLQARRVLRRQRRLPQLRRRPPCAWTDRARGATFTTQRTCDGAGTCAARHHRHLPGIVRVRHRQPRLQDQLLVHDQLDRLRLARDLQRHRVRAQGQRRRLRRGQRVRDRLLRAGRLLRQRLPGHVQVVRVAGRDHARRLLERAR